MSIGEVARFNGFAPLDFEGQREAPAIPALKPAQMKAKPHPPSRPPAPEPPAPPPVLPETAAPIGFWQRLDLFASETVGLDLGTCNTVVFIRKHGVTMSEPSVVAMNGKVIAVGHEARAMVGKTPDAIKALYPLRDGVIADFDLCREMVKRILKKARPLSVTAPAVAVAAPAGVTEVHERAVREAILQAGASRVMLVNECIAAAVGSGVDVHAPKGTFVVSIGGGTTQAAVISLGRLVTSRVSPVAGNALDMAVAEYLLEKHGFLVGERTAEAVKIRLGSAASAGSSESMSVRGRDEKGLPRAITVTSEEIREALEPRVQDIIATITKVLESAPPELAADVVRDGVLLAGGTSLLRGLPERISRETGLAVRVAPDPLTVVAIGARDFAEAAERRTSG